jgi:hypothetical protein
MTLHENKIACEFIKKCGFALDEADRLSKEYTFFIRERGKIENDFVANRFDEAEYTW